MNQRGAQTECHGTGNEWKALVRPLLAHLREEVGAVKLITPPNPDDARYVMYVSGDGIRILVLKDEGRAVSTAPDAEGWFKPAYEPFTMVRVDVCY